MQLLWEGCLNGDHSDATGAKDDVAAMADGCS